MANIYIARAKQYPTLGRNCRFGWRWVYTITWDKEIVWCEGKCDSAGTDTQASAVLLVNKISKANGGGHLIIKLWKWTDPINPGRPLYLEKVK